MSTLVELRDHLKASCEGLQDVKVQRMFGCDGFFAGGNIFGLVWKTGRIGVKLTDSQAFKEAMYLAGSEPWAAGSRVMSHWVLLPESFHDDLAALREWVKLAHSQALHAPPAQKGSTKKKA